MCICASPMRFAIWLWVSPRRSGWWDGSWLFGNARGCDQRLPFLSTSITLSMAGSNIAESVTDRRTRRLVLAPFGDNVASYSPAIWRPITHQRSMRGFPFLPRFARRWCAGPLFESRRGDWFIAPEALHAAGTLNSPTRNRGMSAGLAHDVGRRNTQNPAGGQFEALTAFCLTMPLALLGLNVTAVRLAAVPRRPCDRHWHARRILTSR